MSITCGTNAIRTYKGQPEGNVAINDAEDESSSGHELKSVPATPPSPEENITVVPRAPN